MSVGKGSMVSDDILTSPVFLQINTTDIGGGAEKIAWDLHQGYVSRGYDSWLAVGRKRSHDPTVLRIPNEAYWAFWIKFLKKISELRNPVPTRIRRWCSHLAKIHHRIAKTQGYENFYFPGSRRLLDLPPSPPDIIHCHNLHGWYFDLRALPALSARRPVMLTLHDSWMLSGHCTYSFDCERWKIGCGQCPYLDISHPIRRDASAYNWKRKQRIYTKSRFYVATPSRWLMQMVEQSMLAPAVIEGRVIYNGMDLSHFCPTEKVSVRAKLGIPLNAKVILTTAVKILQNRRKDYPTMREAISLLARRHPKQSLHFIALGGEQPSEEIEQITIQFIPFLSDETTVAQYYQAADIYIHAARADNLPNTVSEALACGMPVVATAVGGIPEQIDDGKTGFLVPPGNPKEMAAAIQKLLQDSTLRHQMSIRAAETAQRRFDRNRMVEEYLEWYQKIIA